MPAAPRAIPCCSPPNQRNKIAAYNVVLRYYVSASRDMDTLEFHAISGRDSIHSFGYNER